MHAVKCKPLDNENTLSKYLLNKLIHLRPKELLSFEFRWWGDTIYTHETVVQEGDWPPKPAHRKC